MGKIKTKNVNLLNNNKIKSSNQKNKNLNLNKIKPYSSKREFHTITTSLQNGLSKSISRENNFKNKANLTLNDSIFLNDYSISSQRNEIKNNLSQINRKKNNFLNNSTRNIEVNLQRSEYDKSNSNLIQIYNRKNDKNLTFNRMEIQIISNNKEKNDTICNLKSKIGNKPYNNKYLLTLPSNTNSLEENIDNDNNTNNEFDKLNKDDSFILQPKYIKKKDSFHLKLQNYTKIENINNRKEKERNVNSKKYLTPNSTIYQINKKQVNYFNSSNDAISTDTNLVNNITYTTINTNLEGNNLTNNNNKPFNKQLIHSNRRLIKDNDYNEYSKLKYNSENEMINKNKENKKKNDENNNENKEKKESVFLEKLKIWSRNKKLNIFQPVKKKKRLIDKNSTFNLSEEQSTEEINLLKGRLLKNTNNSFLKSVRKELINDKNSNNKIITKKIYKRQLSKIPEITLNKGQVKKRNSMLNNLKNMNILQMKEIIDKKIEINNKKKTHTPEKKGYDYFKKIIDNSEIKKIHYITSYDFERDISNSNSSDGNKRKKNRTPTNQSSSSKGVKFINLRMNTLRVSMKEFKSKINREYLNLTEKKLMHYLVINTKNSEQIKYMKKNNKNNLIVKIASYLEENYLNNFYNKNNYYFNTFDKSLKYDKEIDKYILDMSVDYTQKFETILIKNFLKIDSIHIQNKFIRYEIDLFLEKYFRIMLFDYILKKKYLENDIIEEKVDENEKIIKHFGLVKKKIRKLGIRTKNVYPQRPSIILTLKSFKFFNYLLLRDNPIYFEKDINFYSIFEPLMEKKKSRKKNTKTNNNISIERKVSFNHLKGPSRSRHRNSVKVSLKRGSSKTLSFLSIHKINDEEETNILTHTFYHRTRNSFINKKLNSKKINEKIKENILLKKKHAALYISPINYTEQREYVIDIPLRKEDKNYTIYKTRKIKEDLLKNCANYKEALFLYIKDNNIHGFKKTFEKYKASSEITDNDGNSFLNIAVQCGFKQIVNYLLHLGANPNSQNYKLNTPLHYALSYQYFEIADILLRNGANENLKNSDGLTAWQCLNSFNSIL